MSRIINDNGTDRPMTDAEETAYDALMADVKAQQQREAQAIADRAAAVASARVKLTKLGLTDDEIDAFLA